MALAAALQGLGKVVGRGASTVSKAAGSPGQWGRFAVGAPAKGNVGDWLATPMGMTTAVGAAGGTAMLVAPGMNNVINEQTYDSLGASLQTLMEEETLSLSERLRARRLHDSIGRNMARLATHAPDVYNRVRAGRRLPQGAVVIGGQPRTDLLEELALMMGEQEFQGPNPDAELMDKVTRYSRTVGPRGPTTTMSITERPKPASAQSSDDQFFDMLNAQEA